MTRLVVITGGPGSGKSALVEELRSRGYQGIEECARTIIRDQLLIGGRALPWIDPQLFGELLLSWHLRSYKEGVSKEGTVFFDRGAPDTVGYFVVQGLPVPEYVHTAVQKFRYSKVVFLAPPWEEIYRTDDERVESFEEAGLVYRAMAAAYRSAGYDLIELPLASIAERARFALDLLDNDTRALPKRLHDTIIICYISYLAEGNIPTSPDCKP